MIYKAALPCSSLIGLAEAHSRISPQHRLHFGEPSRGFPIALRERRVYAAEALSRGETVCLRSVCYLVTHISKTALCRPRFRMLIV